MARPNVPPRPGQGAARLGSGKARPTAKRRPPAKPPAQKPGGGSAKGGGGASGGDQEEVIFSPGAPRPAQKHLKMVPLNGKSEGTYDDGNDLGTSAFSRPAGHQAPVAPVGGAMGPPPVMGIQGPVAGAAMGPMAAGHPQGMPGMGMPNAYGQMGEDPRATSYRVYMVILAFIMMVCGSILVTGMILLFAFVQANQPKPLSELPSPVVVNAAGIGEEMDTGDGSMKKEVKKPKPRRKLSTKSKSSKGSSSTPKPAAPAKPAEPEVAAGTVTVTLPPGVQASSFQVNCGQGLFRERARFSWNKATMQNVPATKCYLTFVGIGSKKRFSFTGSHNFTCSGLGSNIMCR